MNRKSHWEAVYQSRSPDQLAWHQATKAILSSQPLPVTALLPRCPNLDVVRYAPEELCEKCGPGFHLVRSQLRAHVTPWGSQQQFVFCHFTATVHL